MDINYYSLFCYMTALLLSFFFASLSDRCNNKKTKKMLFFLSFLVTFLFCGLRFFVGNDYYGYYNGFCLSQQYETNVMFWEPLYYLINSFFFHTDIGYFYTLLVANFITIGSIYLTFYRENILKWGVFCLYTLGLLIFINNGVRQGIAIAIFLYSIRFIRERILWKYLLCILVAFSFHFTAIILIIPYFLHNIKLSSKKWLLLLFVVFVLQACGLAAKLYSLLLSFIPYYGEGYLEKNYYTTEQVFGFSILYKYCIALPIIIFSKKINNHLLVNLYLFGLIISALFFGFSLIERIGFYFYFTIILLYPVFFRMSNLKYLVAVVMIAYFSLQIVFALEKDGAVPYRTIINENLVSPNYDKSTQE